MQEIGETRDNGTMEAGYADKKLEELFALAEQTVSRMEDPELPLEDAFAAYEQGIRLLRACNDRIDSVEKKMLVMNREGEPVLFDGEQEA